MADRAIYEDAIARNIVTWRTMRRLTQKSLAARMSALGFGWYQQTVGSAERAERRVTAGEILGLALALESTMSGLLTPAEPFTVGSGDVVLPSGDILTQSDVHALLFNGNTHAVTWDGDTPVFKPGGYAVAPGSVQLPGRAASPEVRQPVVAAIVTSAKGVLVGRRNDGKPPWTFIAGEVEPGERPEDAAVREVKEETGLLVRAGAVIGERVHPKTGRTMIYMAAVPTHGTDVFVGDADELAEVRWVSLAEADELLPGMFGPVHDHLVRELGSDAG
jgi:8-oxo-dGTP pyrophosphatase MutT (NUDIX family)/transcriptional regulator with XRE-family HTH domain